MHIRRYSADGMNYTKPNVHHFWGARKYISVVCETETRFSSKNKNKNNITRWFEHHSKVTSEIKWLFVPSDRRMRTPSYFSAVIWFTEVFDCLQWLTNNFSTQCKYNLTNIMRIRKLVTKTVLRLKICEGIHWHINSRSYTCLVHAWETLQFTDWVEELSFLLLMQTVYSVVIITTRYIFRRYLIIFAGDLF